jgi:hypothetical protein
MDELEAIITWVRAHGPQPLPLEGWDRASIWGWDEVTGSLYTHLRPNTADPAGPPAFKIEPGDYTPPITLLPTLSQYIAMAVDCSPWDAVTALLEVEDIQEYRTWQEELARGSEGGTVVTLTEGHGIWLPPDSGPPLERPE